MEVIQWKKTNAKISLKQKRSLGLFKKKYSFLLNYSVEIIRNKTKEEKERNESHLKTLSKLEYIFPILDPSAMLIDRPILKEEIADKVVATSHMVKDIEVSKELFDKYAKAKTMPLQYDAFNPNTIKIY